MFTSMVFFSAVYLDMGILIQVLQPVVQTIIYFYVYLFQLFLQQLFYLMNSRSRIDNFYAFGIYLRNIGVKLNTGFSIDRTHGMFNVYRCFFSS